jgi:hypothetical protein
VNGERLEEIAGREVNAVQDPGTDEVVLRRSSLLEGETAFHGLRARLSAAVG